MRAGPAARFFPAPACSALLGWALLAATPLHPGRAETEAALGARNYETEAVRALFLFNFARFAEWPEEALPEGAPLVIGVAGARSLEDELFRLADQQTVLERRVRVIRVRNARDCALCHVVYIGPSPGPGESNAPGIDELLPHLRGRPVLTVSAAPTFIDQGGIINFYVGPGGKLRFEISPVNARNSRLVLSSRLLALAQIVDPA